MSSTTSKPSAIAAHISTIRDLAQTCLKEGWQSLRGSSSHTKSLLMVAAASIVGMCVLLLLLLFFSSFFFSLIAING